MVPAGLLTMKLWVVLLLAVLCSELQIGCCQGVKRKKDVEESRGRRVRVRQPAQNDRKGKSQSLLTRVLDKGRFQHLAQTTLLTPGRKMELRCKGSSIGWSYPTNLDTFSDSRLSIKQSDKYSQLILTSPSAADTGSYSCWVIVCDGAECQRDQDRTYTSYIYFPDKDHLFVPSAIHFEIVYLHPDRPAVVPCRVTEPHAEVSLHREVPPEEITTNTTQVTYDPTRGFVLQHPRPEHQGVFYCKAVSKDTPQVSTKYQLLYVEGKDTAVTVRSQIQKLCKRVPPAFHHQSMRFKSHLERSPAVTNLVCLLQKTSKKLLRAERDLPERSPSEIKPV
uniref:Platelet-derived growth factor receptor-like n=2 Tax=Nothobranchius TaxID=28779 RepID=A0A1A8MR54_9TELE